MLFNNELLLGDGIFEYIDFLLVNLFFHCFVVGNLWIIVL